MSTAATIHVDGRSYKVDPSQNLLHACLSAGLNLPYFCWHPALGSVGACRQCAVRQFRDEQDSAGRIVMACMTPAADGTRISIDDPEAVDFRARVIEWLMTNHPHDCPVCEEGGECHLQDMTLMTGHCYRRYRYTKRTHRNQYLGPYINHEMNRCIACYRCVRFYRDYAGGRDLDVYAAHNSVYFGRQQDGPLESEFSGNLVEVCPTGVFTDKTFSESYTRKWDLRSAPSICVHCGAGCNIFVNERNGELRRILNRYNGAVNGYFLCDRGRFGHGFVGAPERIRSALVACVEKGIAECVSREMALGLLGAALDRGATIGIGSPRASLESNFALRSMVGPERFFMGVSEAEGRMLATMLDLMRNGPAPIASMRETEQADAVLILGENVPETAPRLALSLRQSVRQASFALADKLKIPRWQDAVVRDAANALRGPLMIVTPDPTRLDEVSSLVLRAQARETGEIGAAIARAIASHDRDVAEPVRTMASALAGAARPLIVSGCGAGSEAVLKAAADIARALIEAGKSARIHFVARECNSVGLALMDGGPLGEALQALRSGTARNVIVLENDLFERAEQPALEAALSAATQVITFDHSLSQTAHHSTFVLPVATFAESDGTLVNSEGRAQRFFQVLFPDDDVTESWRWLSAAAHAAGLPAPVWNSLDEIIETIEQTLPQFAGIRAAAPSAAFRVAGNPIRSAPHRYSGRTAMHANQTIREPPPPSNPDAPYSNSMEGYYGKMPSALYPYFWAPAWNSVQSLTRFQEEIAGPLRGGDPGIRLIRPQQIPSPPSEGESQGVGAS